MINKNRTGFLNNKPIEQRNKSLAYIENKKQMTNKQELRNSLRIKQQPIVEQKPEPQIIPKNTISGTNQQIQPPKFEFELKREIPKRMFFYWGGSKLSWMRYMSLFSFKKMNPDWNVILYLSSNIDEKTECGSTKMLDYLTYDGYDYLNDLKNIDIKIEKVEFPKEIQNKLKGISPIHESDLFRLYQLFIGGGFYCDMDILFFRPIDALYNEISEGGYDTIIHEYVSDNNVWWSTIGFLGSSINNEYFKNLFECGLNSINEKNAEKYNIEYQAMGVALIYRLLNEPQHIGMFNVAVKRYPQLKFYNISTTLFYNYDWTFVDYCFKTPIGSNSFALDSIGYHWYGGANTAQKYNNILTEKNYLEYKTTFSRIADEIINNKKIEISIVTAYYNRKNLFYNTLKSIAKSKFKNFELIVVDDCSSKEHRLEEYLIEFPFMRIIRIEKQDKNHINPCTPFNIGIRASVGNIIILQNPECMHVHDVLSYVSENMRDDTYISMSAYALSDKSEPELLSNIKNNTVLKYLKQQPQRGHDGNPSIGGWYNHSVYRPVHYNFCSAISSANMNKLNGFDERYANGIGYDDSDFIQRIKRLGLKLIIADDVSVIHQFHPTHYYTLPNQGELTERNRLIFCNSVMTENNIKANQG